MSLLAAIGIGVFKNKHVVLNSNRRCECFGAPPTHEFVWDGLNYWANTGDASRVLLEVIQPGGVPLSQWLNGFSVGSGVQNVLARQWLLQWGLDLRSFSEDRESRNAASYRPTAFTSPGPTGAPDTISFIKHIWGVCEPLGQNHFPILDMHLLRRSLHLAFRRAYGRTHNQRRRLYIERINEMLEGIQTLDTSPDHWRQFLINEDGDYCLRILVAAEGKANVRHQDHSKQVLARAALLLRVAIGVSRSLLRALPRNTREDLRFWWSALGRDRGLWGDSGEPAQFTELWTDIHEAIASLNSWEQATPSSSQSYHRLWQDRSQEAAILGSTERVGLWGLGL